MKIFGAVAVTALLASVGTATASSWINGHRIRPHSIPLNRLAGHLPQGTQGTQGPAGPQGTQGPQGPSGVADAALVEGDPQVYRAGDFRWATAACPKGKTAISGGYLSAPADPNVLIDMSRPSSDLSSWEIGVSNESQDTNAVVVPYAICV